MMAQTRKTRQANSAAEFRRMMRDRREDIKANAEEVACARDALRDAQPSRANGGSPFLAFEGKGRRHMEKLVEWLRLTGFDFVAEASPGGRDWVVALFFNRRVPWADLQMFSQEAVSYTFDLEVHGCGPEVANLPHLSDIRFAELKALVPALT
jgi:hypothetical protein